MAEPDSHTARYDQNASRYHKGVYQRKRADLIGVMESNLSPLFLGQLKNLHKLCLVSFKREMLEAMRGESYNFAEIVSGGRSKFEQSFLTGAKELLIEGVNWSYDEEYSSFQEEIQSVADQCRKDETKKMVNVIEVGPFVLIPWQSSDSATEELQEVYLRTRGARSDETNSRSVGQGSDCLP